LFGTCCLIISWQPRWNWIPSLLKNVSIFIYRAWIRNLGFTDGCPPPTAFSTKALGNIYLAFLVLNCWLYFGRDNIWLLYHQVPRWNCNVHEILFEYLNPWMMIMSLFIWLVTWNALIYFSIMSV
jgi:hypothetical protein